MKMIPDVFIIKFIIRVFRVFLVILSHVLIVIPVLFVFFNTRFLS